MRKFKMNNVMPYEKTWYDRLETMTTTDIDNLILHNPVMPHSADLKYRRVGHFIIILMNKYNRLYQAEYLINKCWSKLNKNDLLSNLFIYGDFDIFKKYWKKNRTELNAFFINIIVRTDELDRAKWLLNDKKFNKLIHEESVQMFYESYKANRWIYFNEDAFKLLVQNKTFAEIVLNDGYEELYPEDIKEIFVF